MNNVYDNGTMILGNTKKVKEYLIENCEECWEVEDILTDIKEFEDNTIVAINYDLGMGYSIEWWTENTKVK